MASRFIRRKLESFFFLPVGKARLQGWNMQEHIWLQQIPMVKDQQKF